MPKKKPALEPAVLPTNALVATKKPPEILVPRIALISGQRLEWRYWVAGTPGYVLLNLMNAAGTKIPLVNQGPPLPMPVTRLVVPPSIPAGSYVLYWGMITSGVAWETCVELLVGGVFVFRHYKSSTSNEPFTRGFMPIEVMA